MTGQEQPAYPLVDAEYHELLCSSLQEVEQTIAALIDGSSLLRWRDARGRAFELDVTVSLRHNPDEDTDPEENLC